MSSLRKLFFSLFIACMAASGCSQTRNVSLKLQYYRPYCGGARPTKEIQEEAQKPKLYANRTIIIMNGEKVDSIQTDEAGMLKKKMKFGTYRLVESWRYYHKTPDGAPMSNYNADCLKGEWQKEFAIIKVTSKKQIVDRKFEIFEQCDRRKPCILESAAGPERE